MNTLRLSVTRHHAGFTLIELLVVISIISLLSSVVLSSLNSARTKAADTAVKAAMKGLRTQSGIYRDTNANFGTGVSSCSSGFFADAQVTKIRANITSNALSSATMACTTDATGFKWALSVSALKGGGSWCVDNNQGWFKAGTSVGGSCQ